MEPKEIIKTARADKGWTQDFVAKKLQIKLRTYQRYEEGKFPKFKSDVIKEIDEILGTSVYETIYDTKFHKKGVPERIASGVEEKYLALLEKTISDKDKNIEEQKADINAYRSTIQKITSVDEKVAALELIVNDLKDKVGGDISNIEVLREWLIDQFSKLKKVSPQSVAASMGRKREELYQKERQHGTRQD